MIEDTLLRRHSNTFTYDGEYKRNIERVTEELKNYKTKVEYKNDELLVMRHALWVMIEKIEKEVGDLEATFGMNDLELVMDCTLEGRYLVDKLKEKKNGHGQ